MSERAGKVLQKSDFTQAFVRSQAFDQFRISSQNARNAGNVSINWYCAIAATPTTS
jgi:hypothetical protein